jgi:hydrogenase maturation factor
MRDPFPDDAAPAARAAPLGKLDPGAFERLIAPRLGARRAEVLLGPRAGCDCAIVRLGGGRVMALTTDPLSLIPALGPELSAWLACHLLASDLWTSAVPPSYAALDLNLPPQLAEPVLERYWTAMSAEWERLGVAVVTGHTGRYAGCEPPILGAGTLIGFGDEDRYLTPAMARPGDRVVVTKGCALEVAAIAAHLFPERLGQRLGTAGLERARALVRSMTVVPDCQAAVRMGVRDAGVTALHDATEGGVLGALVELARACGCEVRVERARLPVSAEAHAACEAFGGIDPYWSVSEGALIATVRPHRAKELLAAFADAGIAAGEVGEVLAGPPVLTVAEPDATRNAFDRPRPDPYWLAYDRAVRQGWR